ncbi:MAG: hypothetical protein GX629_08155, partial [Phycisphaerae bacterium]|nr:hypothetical protein [Phycisphaerae bacterium]
MMQDRPKGCRTRRIRNIVLIALGGLFLLLAAGPYIIPREYLRKKIAGHLSEKTQSAVRVDRASIGWFSGLRLWGLELENNETQACVSISRMKIPIEPVKLLFGGAASFVRLEGVKVELVERAQSPELKLTEFCPSGLPVQRVQLSDLQIDFMWRDGFRQEMMVPWLEFIFDLSNQTVQYDAQAKLQARREAGSSAEYVGRLTTHGNFEFVRQEGQQCLAGTLNVDWQDLDLSILRLERIERFDIAKFAGKSGGNLTLEIFPDFHFRWNSRTRFDDLIVRRGEVSTPGKIDRLTVISKGEFDPVTGKLTLGRLDVSSSPLEISSTMTGRLDQNDFDLATLDLDGRLDMAMVAALAPGLARSLGEEGRIDGPCYFDFSWKDEPAGYQIEVHVNADGVFLDRPGTILKRADDALNGSISIHTDQATWPWVVVDRVDFKVGQTELHGWGRLPPIRSGDDPDVWLDEVRRLAEFEVTVNCPELLWFSPRVPAMGDVLTWANLSGPVGIRLGYTGQEDVGRMDMDVELNESGTLGLGDIFVKPEDEKIDLRFQGFLPWHTREPQVWIYAFGKCGEAEIMTDQRPLKIIWAFTQTPDKKPAIDLFGDVSIEVHGLGSMLAYSPRLKRDRPAEHVGGAFEFELGHVLRATLEDGRWTMQNARVHFELEADKVWVDLPEKFMKPADVPMSVRVDYTYTNRMKQHEFQGEARWCSTQAEFEILRIDAKDNRIEGRGEIRVEGLKNTLNSMPVLSKMIDKVGVVDGGLTMGLQWSSDVQKDKIDWSIDATATRVEMDGEHVKSETMPATMEGQLILPASPDETPRTYIISKLRSQLGQSYVNLEHGSILLRGGERDGWGRMFGVEPWMLRHSGPFQSFSFSLSGHLDAQSRWLRVNRKVREVLDEYGLRGGADFNLEAGFKDSLLQTTFSARLEEMAFEYDDILTKRKGVPGSLEMSVFVWPDAEDIDVCHVQLAYAKFRLSEFYATGRGGGTLGWSSDKDILLNDALAQINVRITDISQLGELSSLVREYEAGGRINVDMGFLRRDGRNSLTGSSAYFSNVNAMVSGQPVMVDGRIYFSEDYFNSDRFLFSAGFSSFKAGWDTVIIDDKITGIADIESDYFDTDQVQQMFVSAVKARRGAVASAIQPTPLPQDKPMDLAYQLGQEDLMRKFQPLRQKLIHSSVLVGLKAKKLHMTDPRTGDRHDLSDFRSQINVEDNRTYNRPTGGLRFWSRISDGLISGNFVAMLDEENPTVILDSSIDNIRMVEEFRPMVENFFPGLRVESRLSITESSQQKLFTTRQSAPNYPVGEGNMIFVDGFMIGRAGPDWIT